MTATTTRRLFAPRFSLVVALGAILSLVLLGSPAHADASTDGTADVVTFDEYRALIDDLTASDVPRTTATVDGRTVHTFTIESPATGTFELSMVDVKSEEEFVGDEGTMHPNLGGGWDSSGPYVSFNQVDQDALIAGTAGALVLAICLIPAVGTLACGVAGILVTVAGIYLVAYGKCPGDLRLPLVTHRPYCA